jgi:hypothetical protein
MVHSGRAALRFLLRDRRWIQLTTHVLAMKRQQQSKSQDTKLPLDEY